MSFSVEYISGHLFVGGVWGTLTSDKYFMCKSPSFPFSLLMEVKEDESKPVAVSCIKAVVPVHFHEPTTLTRGDIKKQIVAQLQYIKKHPNTRQAEVFKTQHAFSNSVARRMSKGYRRHLIDIEALKVYAMNHPGKNSTKLKVNCGLSLTHASICNIVRREKEKIGKVKDIADLIEQKIHHVLGNYGDEIVMFGLTSSIVFLSQTTLIQGDGTFTCVVLPFTQLYMFHALLRNGVSYPVLYCLVRGKNEEIYKHILDLVEKIAKERGTTILNRPVRMMVDFELAFIKATRPFDAAKTSPVASSATSQTSRRRRGPSSTR